MIQLPAIHFMLLTALACGQSGPQAGGVATAQPVPVPTVVHIRLEDEAITPVTVRLIERALQEAEATGATCVIIELDTPGGLVDSTRKAVKSILASRVPVVVYVAPSGARAASAGVFITLSAHVAAMAPGTHIGAAHPVQLGSPLPGTPGPGEPAPAEPADGEAKPSPMEEKLVADTTAWARSLAALRGRNAEWAARAVEESRSVTEAEALAEGAIDLVADDLSQLLEKLDGWEVQLHDRSVRLSTQGAVVHTMEKWWGEVVLGALANPNVAFLLLMFGFYGILFELYTPGWGVAGTLGAVCLLLGFSGLAVLPVNYAGLALIALAVALFVAEAFVTSFGALTVGGVICLVLGGLMLIDSPVGFMRVSLAVVVPVAVATGAIAFFLVGSIVRAHRARVQTGGDALCGRTAAATEDFAPRNGKFAGCVRIHGELWNAWSALPIKEGQEVEVIERDNLTLIVTQATEARPQAAPARSADRARSAT